MERLIRELRHVPNIDTKALERAIQESRDAMRKKEEELVESREKVQADLAGSMSIVVPGQEVHILSLDKDAVVLKKPDARGDVAVRVGSIKTAVQLSDLVPVQARKEKPKASHKIELHDSGRSFLELDVRGMTVDEASIEIDRFIDDATLTGIKTFNIIHGKGTGALRTGVQAYLKHHAAVKGYRIGAYGEGDAGVTVVTLK